MPHATSSTADHDGSTNDTELPCYQDFFVNAKEELEDDSKGGLRGSDSEGCACGNNHLEKLLEIAEKEFRSKLLETQGFF